MQYLRDYAAQLNLNIQYNTEIMSIRKEDGHFVLEDQHKHMYHCNKVIVGLVVWCVGGLKLSQNLHADGWLACPSFIIASIKFCAC